MGQKPPEPQAKQLGRRRLGQEGWYLLAALLGVVGVLIAAAGLAPELGLLVLFFSGLCFGIGVLLHSIPSRVA